MTRIKQNNSVSAKMLLKLLLQKHCNDLCIPECKTGPTHYASTHQKIDLWVMKKSGAAPQTIGYEIKVSRNDFVRDNKWRDYLEFCTDFYFVAPPGIIQTEEVPAETGLLVSSLNGTRLYTKKKSPCRNIEVPESIFRYILMWRTKVVNEFHKKSKAEYWEKWLRRKNEKKELGYMVSKKMRKVIAERIDKVEIKAWEIEAENKTLQTVKQMLFDVGLTEMELVNHWCVENTLKKKLKEIEAGLPNGLADYMAEAINKLRTAHTILVKNS